MSGPELTEAQRVYERIATLKAGGISNAEAIRKVAAETGKQENAIRANQYQHRKKLEGANSTGASRRRARGASRPAVTVEGAVAQARSVLEQALSAIDHEVDAAKAELDATQARYDELVTSVKARRAELEAKIKALG